MQKLFLVTGTLILLTACGSGGQGEKQSESSGPGSAEYIAQGKVLVGTGDCLTCHHLENKIIGPPHMEVARKYDFTDENVKKIARHIIDGGSGVWGEVPMNPHPGMKEEDAEKMAAYILSLDGEKFH